MANKWLLHGWIRKVLHLNIKTVKNLLWLLLQAKIAILWYSITMVALSPKFSPNENQSEPLLRAGETVEVGGAESSFEYQASNTSDKPSNEKIFVYAYPVKSHSALQLQ